MHYRILGPLEVRDGGQVIALPGRKHRELLALLLARANEVVSVDHLLARLWPGHSPVRAKAALQVCVSELRRTLQPDRPARSRDGIVVTHPPGYRLAVTSGTLDAQEFDDLVHLARQACAAGQLERGATLLRDALSLWCGPVLADLAMDELDSNLVTRLHEARLQAFEDLMDVELRLGRHGSVVADLAGTAAEHPYRESLHGQLMVALYRCGRQADAHEVYRDLRTRLADELGIEPGPALRRVHQAILSGAPGEGLPPLSGAASRSVPATSPGGDDRRRSRGSEVSQPTPAQLPGDIDVFTGRQVEFDQLRAYLAAASSATPKVCVISGAGGIGKSALAIHAAHVLRPRFPDGQLYINLHGATVGLKPLAPADALGRWLRALGLDPASVPADTDEAAARFRSLLAGRRVLVVCDDAVDATQVRPLLPAGAGCLTLVTSRRVLATLDNAIHLRLDVLSKREAVAVLERLAGTQRVAAEPQAAAEVARLCDYFPLAVRIAGAKLAAHPDRSIGVLAEHLADERYRLDELQASDMALRSSFAVSYHELRRDPAGHEAARMFRLLGLSPGPDIGPDAAAALAGSAPRTARQMLDLLAEVHLIEHAGRGRYRFHDLLRIYAAERVTEEPDNDRATAAERLLRWYLHTAAAADRMLTPDRPRPPLDLPDSVVVPLAFTGYGQALEWFDRECANLVAATRFAAEIGQLDIAWKLPTTLSVYFYLRKPWTDWVTSHEIGLDVLGRLREPFGEAAIRTGLGTAHYDLQRFRQAVDHLRQALALWRDLQHRWGEAITLNILGSAYRELRHFERAVACFRHALAIWPQIDQTWGKGVTLHNLGGTYRELGQAEHAVSWLNQAITIRRETRDRYGEAWAIHDLGNAYRDLNQFDEAIGCFKTALAIRREIGDRHGEAGTLYGLGRTIDETGKPEAAAELMRRALAIFDDLHDPRAREVRAYLAT